MLVEIWLTPHGVYKFFSFYPPTQGYFVLKNNAFEGLYDSLEECRHYTIDFDNRFGDSAFTFGAE